MFNLKEEIQKNIVRYLVPVIIGLIFLPLGSFLIEFLSLVQKQVIPSLTQKSLLSLSGILFLLVLFQFVWIIYLEKKYHTKFILKLNVLWDKNKNPHCPVCKIPLKYYGAQTKRHPNCKCPKCNQVFLLTDNNGNIYSLSDAQSTI